MATGDASGLTERLAAALVGDRPVVLWGSYLAAATDVVALLADLGARRPLVVAWGTGTGPLPPEGSCEAVVVELPSPGSVSAEVRREERLGLEPPAEALAALEAYDPDGRAVVLATPFTTARTVAGRPVLDGRRAEWAALEDKTLVDQLLDAAGVPRPESVVVAAAGTPLRTAAAGLDAGSGTVWSGDSLEGMNGGADLVRRVGRGADPSLVVDLMAAHCRRVRVAPFVEGLPCSVHGLVAPDGVAALRPVEMVILRGPTPDRFTYAGAATWWDPTPADRAAMRDHARAVGAVLADRVGFRGCFSLDGIMGRDGFVATEVNPRFTGGLMLLARSLPEVPVRLVQAALVSGVDLGLDVTGLEDLLVAAADARRGGGASPLSAAVRPDTTTTVPVVPARDGDFRPARRGEEAAAVLQLGPAGVGGLVRFLPGDGLVPTGRPVAPLAVGALRLADALWGTRLGPLAPALEVR